MVIQIPLCLRNLMLWFQHMGFIRGAQISFCFCLHLFSQLHCNAKHMWVFRLNLHSDGPMKNRKKKKRQQKTERQTSNHKANSSMLTKLKVGRQSPYLRIGIRDVTVQKKKKKKRKRFSGTNEKKKDSPKVRETGVQSQVTSYLRLKKWFLIPPCLTSSSSSRHAGSTDIPEPLSPLFPIVHRLRQVFWTTSRILT